MKKWFCPECKEVFNASDRLFHCLHCDHHYRVGEDCGNCYRKSGNMPKTIEIERIEDENKT